LILAADAEAGTLSLIVLGGLIGLVSPPIFAAIQSLLTFLARPRDAVQAAFALEAVLQEIVFLAGPALVAVLASQSPEAALLTCGGLTLIGGASFSLTAGARRFESGQSAHQRLVGALSSAGIRTFALVGLLVGVTFGTFEVALPAFAGAHGSPATGGLLLAEVALGSMIGGIWHGGRHVSSLADRYVAYVALLALVVLPLSLADSILAMALIAPVAGLFIAPTFAAQLALVGELAPPGKLTEAFTWLVLAIVLGIGGGNALAGALIESAGTTAAFLAASAAPAAGALIALARRPTLTPA
jgi:hypothetical protein